MRSSICRVVVAQLVLCASISARSSLYEAKRSHKALDLTENQMKLVSLKTEMTHFNEVLDNILVPRVVGTEGHKKVASYIADEMKKLNWDVERNAFKDDVPIFGELEFENIVAKLNPNSDRYLVLACHYDSKYMREHNFVGATDSAVPCSMMINLAKAMENELSAIKENNDVSLAFIFFDGEEAFRQWGPKDSIYGSRHLASKWHNQTFTTKNNAVTNHIDRIDVLVLLDLLGASNPKFYSYFVETERWFVRLVEIEESLSEMGQLRKNYKSGYDSRYFIPRSVGAHIEDDHIPFMKLGVPILHIIPSPFPEVWHKPSDDRNALDMDTIENLNKIFRVFVAEYLHISI